MPDESLARPAAPHAAGRAAFSPDAVTDAEPSDLNKRDANGHVVWGPRWTDDPLARHRGTRILGGVEIAPREKAPAAERRSENRAIVKQIERRKKMLTGQRPPVRRKAA